MCLTWLYVSPNYMSHLIICLTWLYVSSGSMAVPMSLILENSRSVASSWKFCQSQREAFCAEVSSKAAVADDSTS